MRNYLLILLYLYLFIYRNTPKYPILSDKCKYLYIPLNIFIIRTTCISVYISMFSEILPHI